MFIKKDSKIQPLLADMHMDGTRFDPKILEALKAMRANQDTSTNSRNAQ